MSKPFGQASPQKEGTTAAAKSRTYGLQRRDFVLAIS